MAKKNPFHMPGTEGTGEYTVVLVTADGTKVGYREYQPNNFRIRVEPGSDAAATAKIAVALTRTNGWKQPGDSDENRFSKVREGVQALLDTLGTLALNLFDVADYYDIRFNPDAPRRDSTHMEEVFHRSLVSEARRRKLRGANSRWKLPLLVSRLASIEHHELVMKVPGANKRWHLRTLRAKVAAAPVTGS
ncbi:MAG: hypothetical protein K2W82_16050 [Candidatus Obscuribacterales bacterium]|nr:hypothetical protein [Candidatus Obscuribacterales bacterium]